jgi:hypothetical protein
VHHLSENRKLETSGIKQYQALCHPPMEGYVEKMVGYEEGCTAKHRDGWVSREIGGYVKEWVAK